jgi:hypothetical protein
MLANARIGSTLVLYATVALGLDGDDVIVEGRGGPSYKVHTAYVIPVPDEPRVRQGDPVVTEQAGVLRHAVVTKLQKDKTLVRYTDLDARAKETALKHARFIRQIEGLMRATTLPRAAATPPPRALVSSFTEGGTKRWLALASAAPAEGRGERTRPIPIKYSPKLGTTVWPNVGTLPRDHAMAPRIGLFTVKYEQAGRPAVVGRASIPPWIERDTLRRFNSENELPRKSLYVFSVTQA